jgi:hypothetical protein
MRSSQADIHRAQATKVRVTSSALLVDLADGRTLRVPLEWYPRLVHGTVAQRRRWSLLGRGTGIRWPELDEDISVGDLLAGRPSGESRVSVQRWLRSRGRATAKRTRSASRVRRR